MLVGGVFIVNKLFIRKVLLGFNAAILSIAFAISPLQVSANSVDCNDPRLSSNDILFWNPCDSACTETSSSDGLVSGTPSGAGYDKLRAVTAKYGEYAMEMQREFGTPWEMVFAQMQKESGVGSAGAAINGATNNWLGIKGTGDAGTTGRDAIYSSVEASIKDWAGFRVLRAGFYDAAFVHLDPNNYSITEFIKDVIPIYAPGSDNNNPTEYIADLNIFLKVVDEVRVEKGWPTSAELAKKENIPIGGKTPIGEKGNSSGSVEGGTSSEYCASSGNITEGGLTEEQAKKFMMNYGKNPNMYSSLAVGPAMWSICGAGGSNCVTFSLFFNTSFTDLPAAPGDGNGDAIVGSLMAKGAKGGTEPRPFSTFSVSGTGGRYGVHTGIVLGIHGDTIITGHASCTLGNQGIGGEGDGSYGSGSGYVVVTKLGDNRAYGGAAPSGFAYPDKVDTEKIKEFLAM